MSLDFGTSNGYYINMRNEAVSIPAFNESVQPSEAFNAQQYLEELGIGALADRAMIDHEGNVTTLAAAMRDCPPARFSVEAQVETFKEVGVDPALGMSKHLDKMSEAAQRAAPEFHAAKKKIENEAAKVRITPNNSDNSQPEVTNQVPVEVAVHKLPLASSVKREISTQTASPTEELPDIQNSLQLPKIPEKPNHNFEAEFSIIPQTNTKLNVIEDFHPVIEKSDSLKEEVVVQQKNAKIPIKPSEKKPEQTNSQESIARTALPLINEETLYHKEEAVESEIEDTTIDVMEAPLDLELPVYIRRDSLQTILEDLEIQPDDYEILQTQLPFLDISESYDILQSEDSAEMLEPTYVSRQLAEFIQTLEPSKELEATAILAILMEDIKDIVDFPDTITLEKTEEMEILCIRLLECLGVEPNKETSTRLLRILILEAKIQIANQILDEGTHEKKQSIFQLMGNLGDLIPSSQLLGRYVLLKFSSST